MIRWLKSLWGRLLGHPVCSLCGAVAQACQRFRVVGIGHGGKAIRACADCRTVRLVARSGRRLSL